MSNIMVEGFWDVTSHLWNHANMRQNKISYKGEDLALQLTKGVTSYEMLRRMACTCWTGDAWMRLLFKSVRMGNAGNWSVLVPAGKEIKRDAVSKSDRKQRRANWILVWKYKEMWLTCSSSGFSDEKWPGMVCQRGWQPRIGRKAHCGQAQE